MLVLPACKGGANAEAAKLIPDEAEMIIGMNPKAITESELYKAFGSEMEKEADFQEAMSAFKDCGIEPHNIEAVVIGIKAASEDFVAVVGAEGIGKDDTASCIIKKIQKMNGDEEVADVTKDSGHKIIQFTDGRAYLVNDNMLALATTAWEDKIGELIDGKGTPAVDNSKKELYGKVDSKAAVWFLAEIPSEMAAGAAMIAPEASKVKTAIGSLDFSKGVAVNVVAGFGSAEDAKATAESAQKQFDEVKGMAALIGMSSAAESVKIEAAGSDVKVSASASMDEIKALQAMGAEGAAPAGG
ncbi:hypothetical protein ACNOYE_11745 [Nannocystaceae bacterium ST9]